MKKTKRELRKGRREARIARNLAQEKAKVPVEQQLLREWRDCQSGIERQIGENLEYHYGNEKFKNVLIQALAFWNFFISRFIGCSSSDHRRNFLAMIDPGENMLLRIILKIELMPVAVFRRILWKHNIDFMSLESFLRRLSMQQMAEIEMNYSDLFGEGIVPRVFGKIERFLRRITVEKLLSIRENTDHRYSRKAAWSYNLLNLGFGFNAYPEGIADDTRIIEISPLRFLSIKNHADDFVVNQENGGYWWLYKNARSNYIYKPNKSVSLNTHICPGFWWTFIVHLYFWILSPLAFSIFCSILLNDGFSMKASSIVIFLLLLLLGLLTPLWSIAALIKFVYCNIISEHRRNYLKDAGAIVGLVAQIIFVIAVCLIMLVLYGFVASLLYEFLHPAFGACATIAIEVGITYYLGIQIYEDGDVYWSFEEDDILYWLPMMLLVCGIMARFIIDYGEWLAKSCLRLAVATWEALVVLGPVVPLALFPIVMMFYVFYVSEKWDRDRQEKFFTKFNKLFPLFIVPMIIFGIIYMANIVGVMATFAFVGIMALMSGLCWYFIQIMVPDVYDVRMVVNCATAEYSSIFDSLDYKLLLNSEWFNCLNPDERKEKIERLVWVVTRAYEKGSYHIGYALLIPKMSTSLLILLEENIGVLWHNEMRYCDTFIRELLKGENVYDAKAIAEISTAQHCREKNVRYERFMKPFYYLGDKAANIIDKVTEIFVTLARLYQLLNKRCPIMTQPGIIKTNISEI